MAETISRGSSRTESHQRLDFKVGPGYDETLSKWAGLTGSKEGGEEGEMGKRGRELDKWKD